MKKTIRLLAGLLALCLTLPLFPVSAQAKSATFWESAKADVPLRNHYGSEFDIKSRLSAKGTVVTQVDKEINWTSPFTFTVWYKVQVNEGCTNNGLSGDFWVYSERLTKHKHTLAAGACTATGCLYAETIETVDKTTRYLEITTDNAQVRERPYNDGAPVQQLAKGTIVTATAQVKNYKNSVWYKLKSGNYIFSGNVKEATPKKVDATNSSIINSGGGSSPSLPPEFEEFITYDQLPCIRHYWSVGVCTTCNAIWPMTVTPVSGTFTTKEDNTTAKKIPYKQGDVMKTYPKKGTVVTVTGMHINSVGNTWYRTEDGYWIFGVKDVSMTSATFAVSGHTFTDLSASWTPKLSITPSGAKIASYTWSSSNTDIARVNSKGVVTATVAPGKAIISCRVESAEGAVIIAKAEVVVPEAATLEDWDYDNQTFEYDLAVECSSYMCLAYPRYDYTYQESDLIVFNTGKSPKTPNNLIRLLQSRGMSYQISQNYYNKTQYNSPYVLATKYVNYNGKATPVVYVIIEGSAGRPGWEGNMMVSGTSYKDVSVHTTFEAAANDILSGLHTYIKNYSEKPLVVITGHSRGAAVGGLLAEKLNHDKKVSKVYAYNFATPNATKNPVASKNIFNICNENDLVPHIPFSGDSWGFQKHGITYSFSSAELHGKNYPFTYYANLQMSRSAAYSRNEPDYQFHNGSATYMRDYAMGKWKNLSEYYQHTTDYVCDYECYNYFKDGLAAAASMGSGLKGLEDIEILASHLHANDTDLYSCVFRPFSWFFACNGISAINGLAAFGDSHEAATYHAAMLSRTYNSGDSLHLFHTEEYGNGTVALNSDEYDCLYNFFTTQGENALMLELEGWDVADPDTWAGVLWDLDGHIVHLDLSYMNLTGWLDVSDLSKLQTLDIDGNGIDMLALGDNQTLTELSCSFNQLSSLDVTNCKNLQSMSCSYNALESLDVGGMSNLQQLYCFGNVLNNLNLDGASSLSTLDCSNNNLTSVDLSTNTSLSTFFCENNYVIASQNAVLSEQVDHINEVGGVASIGVQKYIEGYGFNESEVYHLTEFANSAQNLEKLGWDLNDPRTWSGVEWKIYGDEYHISSVNFNDMDLEGTLNLPEAAYLESLSCEGASLSALNLSGCSAVAAVNCSNAGLSTLELSGCTALSFINCNDNYLEVEEVESSLNQIGLQTGLATYENQNIGADEECFDTHEREVLIDFLSTGSNAEILGWDWNWPGTWDGIIWTKDEEGTYRVNKVDFTELPVTGSLDLTGFDYLEDFHFSGTELESITLPDCITSIPAFAFYNSSVESVSLADGLTSIKEQAFAFCKNLKTIVLPATVTCIEAAAFQSCDSLTHAVFLGDELLISGSDIFKDCAPSFRITYFADSSCSEDNTLLSNYLYDISNAPYLLLLDSDLALTTDDTYSPVNVYAGDTVKATIITPVPGTDVLCMLAVYNEAGALDSVKMQQLSLDDALTEILFHNVNIQYVSEESCLIKLFLCTGDGSMTPLAECMDTLLFKPSAS